MLTSWRCIMIYCQQVSALVYRLVCSEQVKQTAIQSFLVCLFVPFEQFSKHLHNEIQGSSFLKQEQLLVLQFSPQPHLISSKIVLGVGGIKQYIGFNSPVFLSNCHPLSVRAGETGWVVSYDLCILHT